jgi:MFS family permease
LDKTPTPPADEVPSNEPQPADSENTNSKDTDSQNPETYFETDVPSRMDRLPWVRWHWLVVVALGVTWVLDGLQVTLAGAVAGVLKLPEALGLSEEQIGLSASYYLTGAVLGAIFFGYATDRFGRKKLFYITLSVYLIATALTAFSWNFASYAYFLFMIGSGIGGEYAAINSAIDELIPARVRGRVDLIINSTYWVGAIIGAGATVILLNPKFVPTWLGWRLAFGIGALLGLLVLYVRHWVPESPRWLMVHGRRREAEKIVSDIEDTVSDHHKENLPPTDHQKIGIHTRTHTPLGEVFRAIFRDHPTRSLLGLTLMGSQAFFYNAIFFTFSLVLTKFYGTSPHDVSWYILPFALGNALGPIVLGHFFDTVGRKPMIAITYGLAGVLLAITAVLFSMGVLNATTQTICWTVIFFVASSAASSAYLTVSEIFPLEIRAMAIAVFYAVGTLIGGVAAPYVFAKLIAQGSREILSYGYYGGATLMIIASITELIFGVAAEGKSLESISAPLSSLKKPLH